MAWVSGTGSGRTGPKNGRRTVSIVGITLIFADHDLGLIFTTALWNY